MADGVLVQLRTFKGRRGKPLRPFAFRSGRCIDALCSKLQGIFDPHGGTIYSNRSLTLQQQNFGELSRAAAGNALAPGFMSEPQRPPTLFCLPEKYPSRGMYIPAGNH